MASLIPNGIEKRVTYTSKDTTFPVWKDMMFAHAANIGFDMSGASSLSIKHGWEFGETPASFVQLAVDKLQKMRSRTFDRGDTPQ
jgi:hypothetical protein